MRGHLRHDSFLVRNPLSRTIGQRAGPWKVNTLVTSRTKRATALLVAALLAGCGSRQGGPAPSSAPSPPAEAPTESPSTWLTQGLEALHTSRYERAERLLQRVLDEGSESTRDAALAGLAETYLLTGRRAEAADLAREHGVPSSGAVRHALLALGAEALRRQGRLDEGLALLDHAREEPRSPGQLEVALVRGQILLEQGRRDDAHEALLEIIEAYNEGHVPSDDGRALAVVGRAAHLLRSPHDANDAFDEAERASPGDVRTLLWRAELYLDKYDLAHADEVVTEALERAPDHPAALVWKAHVRLGQALDFDEAERLARSALEVDPGAPGAHFVLAGISLRDEELAEAQRRIERGLQHNARDLDLLSLAATVRFLADDTAGFDRALDQVLELNPHFTRLFQIVGEFADWEHRYDEIVRLMRRATRIDPEDGRSRAQLGLNLIRAGRDAAGVVELRRAFQSDPFNVRVFNTLELYEKIIPRDYDQVRTGRFDIRYPKAERALLERYVPDLLERAYRVMAEHYGFEPEAPIGIELYESREQFAVRTSGLPQTAIQGVCFGKTLATLSLAEEPANLGMTLWHELAHVFHIQLSKSRVPRWFTEGLAELETALHRPEWSRELDPQLFGALRDGRLPPVAHMSRAFTRAERMEDVATAYFASSQIATYLEEEHGMAKLAAMLQGWGAGRTAPEVISTTLQQTPEELDGAFRKHLTQRLAHFSDQFVPQRWRGSLQARREAAAQKPKDPDAQLAYAAGLFDLGRAEDAGKRVRAVLERHPDHPDALFVQARMQLAQGDSEGAKGGLQRLVASGHDGYEPRLLLAKLTLAAEDTQGAQEHLTAAHRFDPRAAEPLVRLAALHRQRGDEDAELDVLRRLAPLEEHAGHVHRRLLELLVARSLWSEAVAAGEAALWTNLSDARIHALFSRALEAQGDRQRALFELESAALCPGRPEDRAALHEELADAYARAGQAAKARQAREEARRLRTPRPPAPSDAP